MINVELSSDQGTFQPKWVFGGIEEGEPVRVPQFSDKSYAMWGNWSTSGSITLQGSWDKSNTPNTGSWITLYESDNTTAVTCTANAAGVILENPIWIRPKCTVAVTSVTVCINCTKGFK